jgi:hypothetical protein
MKLNQIFRICGNCGEEKTLDMFYRKKKCRYNRDFFCKTCRAKMAKSRYAKNKQNKNWVESERARARKKYWRLYVGKKIDPQMAKKIKLNYFKKYPEKKLAEYKSQNMPCGVGYNNHHWSYNKEHYKDVINLSILEHRKLHRYMIYDQERMMYRTVDGVLLDTKDLHLKYYESLKDKP